LPVRIPHRTHRDPFWEIDGPSARREHRARRAKALVAFGASVAAVGGAAFIWTVKLGFAAAVGIRIALPIG
jgi:hypothetical protein